MGWTKYKQMEVEDIVWELAKGKSVKDVAKENGINNRTLEAKLMRCRAKFSCKNNMELLALFLRKNILNDFFCSFMVSWF